MRYCRFADFVPLWCTAFLALTKKVYAVGVYQHYN